MAPKVHWRRPAAQGDRLARIAAALLLWSVRLSNRKLGIAVLYHEVVEAASRRTRDLRSVLGRMVQAAAPDAARRPSRRRPPAACLPPRRVAGGGRIPIAITFDDDLLARLQVAGPRLAARGCRRRSSSAGRRSRRSGGSGGSCSSRGSRTVMSSPIWLGHHSPGDCGPPEQQMLARRSRPDCFGGYPPPSARSSMNASSA